jgi:hypothetical protein
MKTIEDKEWQYLVNMPDEEIDLSDILNTFESTAKSI